MPDSVERDYGDEDDCRRLRGPGDQQHGADRQGCWDPGGDHTVVGNRAHAGGRSPEEVAYEAGCTSPGFAALQVCSVRAVVMVVTIPMGCTLIK
jgi:hypothetical protein